MELLCFKVVKSDIIFGSKTLERIQTIRRLFVPDKKTVFNTIIYMEQGNKENSAKGILVKVNMEYDYFLDDFTAINSFKKILLEIN